MERWLRPGKSPRLKGERPDLHEAPHHPRAQGSVFGVRFARFCFLGLILTIKILVQILISKTESFWKVPAASSADRSACKV